MLFLRQLSKFFKVTPYAVVGVLFILMIGVLIYELQTQYHNILSEASMRAMQRSQLVSQSLNSKLMAGDYVLRDVLGHVSPKDLVYPDPDAKHLDSMVQLLKTKSNTVPDFFTMVLFNKDCVFTALDTGQHMGARSSREWCEAAKLHKENAPMISFVSAKQSPSGVAVISISRILLSATGEFEGAAVAAIEVGTLQKWLDSLSLSEDDAVAIIDASGVLLARQPLVINKIGEKFSVPEVDRLIASGTPAVTSTREGADGQVYVVGFSKTSQFPLFITFAFNKSKLLADWRGHAIELIVGCLIFFLLAILVVRTSIKAQKTRQMVEMERSRLDERELLMQDMHDGFGSQLASASLMAEKGGLNADQVKSILSECLNDLYLVVDALGNHSQTLAQAIADYRYRLERRLVDAGLCFHWLIQLDDMPQLSPRIVLQLLRILQEAIANALKHADANNLWIEFDYTPNSQMLRMTIRDDGVGLAEQAPKGRGLPGMKGRTRAIGAQLEVGRSASSPGTQLILYLQLEA